MRIRNFDCHLERSERPMYRSVQLHGSFASLRNDRGSGDEGMKHGIKIGQWLAVAGLVLALAMASFAQNRRNEQRSVPRPERQERRVEQRRSRPVEQRPSRPQTRPEARPEPQRSQPQSRPQFQPQPTPQRENQVPRPYQPP